MSATRSRTDSSSATQRSLAIACERGAMCVHDGPGHGLGALQLRLALATPGGWTDARVLAVEADGWIELERWEAGDRLRVWQHSEAPVEVGAPVALHERYGVLADGARRLNVAAA